MGRLSSAQLRAKKAWETRRAREKMKKKEVAQTSVSTSSTGPVKVGRVGVSKTTWTLDQINEFGFVGFPVGDSGEYRVLTVDGRPAQNDVLA